MIDTSPSAFPVPADNAEYGISKREYFAGQALVGLSSSAVGLTSFSAGEVRLKLADTAYKLADAMLEAGRASHE